MSHDQQLYQYLYQPLPHRYVTVLSLFIRKFPSQREICQRYNAGITTVRKVMKLLVEEGYIRTAQGQPL